MLLALAFTLNQLSMANYLPYPDASLPKGQPEVFAEGLISQPKVNEFRMSIRSDGCAYYFSIYDTKARNYRIMQTELNNGDWSKPSEMAGTQLGNFEPFITPDGQRFYFSSNLAPAKNSQDSRIWRMSMQDGQWGKPEMMPLNSGGSEWVANETASGRIYFASFDASDKADIMVYDPKLGNSHKLPVINTADYSEYEPFISNDESFLLFVSNRGKGKRPTELYISRSIDGQWQPALKFAASINNGEAVYSPTVSPDGRFLFFSRDGDFYWVDFEAALKQIDVTLL